MREYILRQAREWRLPLTYRRLVKSYIFFPHTFFYKPQSYSMIVIDHVKLSICIIYALTRYALTMESVIDFIIAKSFN